MPTPDFQLYQGRVPDCLRALRNECCNFIWTDPPYLLSNGGTTVRGGQRVSVDKGDWDQSKGTPNTDYHFHQEWITSTRRLLKWPMGTIMISGTRHSVYHCGYALLTGGWKIINEIIWEKKNPPPNLGCRCFTDAHEIILWASLGKKARHQFNYRDMKEGDWHLADPSKSPGKQMKTVWKINAAGKNEKEFGAYPTQKPLELVKRCIAACTSPGDTVLDPFCGSGTTGVAALMLGRKFIGFDASADALELAQKRCASVT